MNPSSTPIAQLGRQAIGIVAPMVASCAVTRLGEPFLGVTPGSLAHGI